MGHRLADAFKKGLKEFYPEAQLVGEDYHKLFLTDFAPYLTKIKAAGAEVIWTGDWTPDAGNLLKQARQLGITIPFANLFMDEPNMLHEVGVEGTKGLVHIDVYDMPYVFKNYPDFIKFYSAWHKQWQTKVEGPLQHPPLWARDRSEGLYGQSIYWLLSVIERAKSTDAEKIISVWENDTFRFANGNSVKMRACDHKMIGPMGVTEFAGTGKAENVHDHSALLLVQGHILLWTRLGDSGGQGLPSMDKNIDRCKGKNDWGE